MYEGVRSSVLDKHATLLHTSTYHRVVWDVIDNLSLALIRIGTYLPVCYGSPFLHLPLLSIAPQ